MAKSKPKKFKKLKPSKTVHQQLVEIERREKKKKNLNLGMAIFALVLNILILPGIGSIIGYKTREGSIQMILAVFGFLIWLFSFSISGIILMIIAWVWALITGIKIVQESN